MSAVMRGVPGGVEEPQLALGAYTKPPMTLYGTGESPQPTLTYRRSKNGRIILARC